MAAHTLRRTQQIPVSLEQVWEFFSTPVNLETITPENMSFQIISRQSGDMIYPGQLIEYKVKPLLGISFYWMTEITYVKDREYFVDEQRFGPYRFWQHQHFFKAMEGGVEMTDIVHYKLKFGAIGRLVNRLLVRKKLEEIFDYRFRKIEEVFGKVHTKRLSQ